jgi:hypothetical protein
MKSEIDYSERLKIGADFLKANGPGGWIDDLRKERDTLKAQRDALEGGLKSCLEWMEFTIPCLHATCPHCHKLVNVGGLNWGGPINKARTALALCAKDLR